MAKDEKRKMTYNFEEISTNLNIYLPEEEVNKINSIGDQISEIIISNPISNQGNLDEYREIYEKITEIWQQYGEVINNVVYTMPVSLEEKIFITNYITKELPITPENIFIAMRVRDKVIKPLLSLDGGDVNLHINIDNVTVLYHLIKGYSAKGIENSNVIIFGAVIAKIGAIERIYDSISKYMQGISELVTKWTTELDKIEDSNIVGTMEGPTGA